MTVPEALRLVAMLTAYFRQELSDETAILWANSLTSYELTDGMEAATVLGEGLRFMPSLAEFEQAVRECRNDRIRRDSKPLAAGPTPTYYPFALFLHQHPEMADRVKAMEATQYRPPDGKTEKGKKAQNSIIPTLSDLLRGEMPEEAKA